MYGCSAAGPDRPCWAARHRDGSGGNNNNPVVHFDGLLGFLAGNAMLHMVGPSLLNGRWWWPCGRRQHTEARAGCLRGADGWGCTGVRSSLVGDDHFDRFVEREEMPLAFWSKLYQVKAARSIRGGTSGDPLARRPHPLAPHQQPAAFDPAVNIFCAILDTVWWPSRRTCTELAVTQAAPAPAATAPDASRPVQLHTHPRRPSRTNPTPLSLAASAGVKPVGPPEARGETAYIYVDAACWKWNPDPETRGETARKRGLAAASKACTANKPKRNRAPLNCLHPSLSPCPSPPLLFPRPCAMAAAAPTKVPATMRAVQYDACGGGAEGLKLTARRWRFS
ncbi:hypothetical protein HU200_036084 [Digitaria exilis]|uniref:Uncharacterized protein n=1 Tax=Digitaria exilis TaxID=1010633 RepID=A0A835EKK1_9POAL|nr:hypothetical protein HU200_036084 [Digitaria exilis]